MVGQSISLYCPSIGSRALALVRRLMQPTRARVKPCFCPSSINPATTKFLKRSRCEYCTALPRCSMDW
jgi:hypothetical protein